MFHSYTVHLMAHVCDVIPTERILSVSNRYPPQNTLHAILGHKTVEVGMLQNITLQPPRSQRVNEVTPYTCMLPTYYYEQRFLCIFLFNEGCARSDIFKVQPPETLSPSF